MDARSAPGARHFEGVGLHTGAACRLSVRRTAAGTGIRFRRVDLPGAPMVPAHPASIVASARRTVLGRDGVSISTVEHLLATLAGLELWDALVEVEGPEVPILDGSALPLVNRLSGLGRSPRALRELKEPITVVIDGASARADPAERFWLSCTVDFAHSAIGTQRVDWDGSQEGFIREVAPARTFGFVAELDELRRRGLIAGGSPECALVYGPAGPLNPPRFTDEVARHKLLDAVGDLALLGCLPAARITLHRPGHTLLAALVRKLETSWQ